MKRKYPKYDYKVTFEQPRILRTKQDTDNKGEVVVDTYVTYIYGRKNKEQVLRTLRQPKYLKVLRKQGLDITKADVKKYGKKFDITRITK